MLIHILRGTVLLISQNLSERVFFSKCEKIAIFTFFFVFLTNFLLHLFLNHVITLIIQFKSEQNM